MLSHTLQFAVLLAMFTNLTQHVFHVCLERRYGASHCDRFGPAYLVAAATCMVMMKPTHLVLRVAKQIPPLSPMPYGYIMSFATWTGYALLFWGVMWSMDAWPKIRRLLGLDTGARQAKADPEV